MAYCPYALTLGVYSFIDGRPKTAAEKQREKRLLDDPLAELHGPLFVNCKRCGTRIKLSPKSCYDPFHWVKHRERCLRRSVQAVQEIVRVREEGGLSAKYPQQDAVAVTVGTQLAGSSRALPPSPLLSSSPSSPSLRRPSDTDSITPSLTADEDEMGKRSHSSHSGQRELPPDESEVISIESDGSPPPSPWGVGAANPPLSSLSVFRAPDMLAFEDYLHRSRRLPTRLGFPDLLPAPDRWHDWSWGQLRAPVYVVAKRPEEAEAAAGADPPLLSSHGNVNDGILQPEVIDLTGRSP